MDYTAAAALASGFDDVVVIVRDEIRDEVEAHIRARWPGELPVRIVCQMALAGTAPAVLSAGEALRGPFGVANADDLYGAASLATLARSIGEATGGGAASGRSAGRPAGSPLGGAAPSQHVMVGYRLANTVLTDAAVTRGVCEVDGDERLVRIVEQSVRRRAGGGFDAAPLGPNRKADPDATWPWQRDGRELVSMNLWGFTHDVLDALQTFVDSGRDEAAAEGSELLLPDAVAGLVGSGSAVVRVVPTASRCIGLTHPDDLDLVRGEVAVEIARAPIGS